MLAKIYYKKIVAIRLDIKLNSTNTFIKQDTIKAVGKC